VRRVIPVLAAAIFTAGAAASAPPVGRLPSGSITTVHIAAGKTYTARLPQPKVAGRVWRIARSFDARVVREVREGETRQQVWVEFRAVKPGSTRIVFALTRGETSHAFAARSFRFVVG
jgi:predicted secreted protein